MSPYTMAQPLISLDNVTVRLRDRWYLRNTNWEILPGQHWAVLGPNGSGKTTLARTVAGRLPVVKGAVRRHFQTPEDLEHSILMVSSEERTEVHRQEGVLDQARHFSGKIFDTTPAHAMLRPYLQGDHVDSRKALETAGRELGIEALLSRPLLSLSTGEMSKLLLARAVAAPPALLILDEPFDGLDMTSRKQMEAILSRLMARRVHILFITHRVEEIFSDLTHVLLMQDGSIAARGEKSEILHNGRLGALYRPKAPKDKTELSLTKTAGQQKDLPAGSPVIEMERVRVRYGPVQVLEGVTWRMHRGENWAITGPNGAGKSTLLQLITGDELQVYANSIRLFGKQRGSGESIWALRQNIGTVSHSLLSRYHKPVSVFETVCSGFFDSVGLYKSCTPEQKAAARHWIHRLGIEDLQDCPLPHLSKGQRALVLITRAMVKSPLLLLLDEPCAGLDAGTRQQVLDLVEWIGSSTATDLIYVTHYQQELVPCITHKLQLKSGRTVAAGPARGN